MSGPTPGPWTATHTDPAEGYDCWWITACPASNQEKEVATVSGGFPHEKHEANARLIAASPCLLEALEGLLDGMPIPAGSEYEFACPRCSTRYNSRS